MIRRVGRRACLRENELSRFASRISLEVLNVRVLMKRKKRAQRTDAQYNSEEYKQLSMRFLDKKHRIYKKLGIRCIIR